MRQPRGKTALLEGFNMEAGTETPNRGGTESEGRTCFCPGTQGLQNTRRAEYTASGQYRYFGWGS